MEAEKPCSWTYDFRADDYQCSRCNWPISKHPRMNMDPAKPESESNGSIVNFRPPDVTGEEIVAAMALVKKSNGPLEPLVVHLSPSVFGEFTGAIEHTNAPIATTMVLKSNPLVSNDLAVVTDREGKFVRVIRLR